MVTGDSAMGRSCSTLDSISMGRRQYRRIMVRAVSARVLAKVTSSAVVGADVMVELWFVVVDS